MPPFKHAPTSSPSSKAQERRPSESLNSSAKHKHQETGLNATTPNKKVSNFFTESKFKQRFTWNAFPETRAYIDGSQLSSVVETKEFKSVYDHACQLFATEGGGKLSKDTFRVNYCIK